MSKKAKIVITVLVEIGLLCLVWFLINHTVETKESSPYSLEVIVLALITFVTVLLTVYFPIAVFLRVEKESPGDAIGYVSPCPVYGRYKLEYNDRDRGISYHEVSNVKILSRSCFQGYSNGSKCVEIFFFNRVLEIASVEDDSSSGDAFSFLGKRCSDEAIKKFFPNGGGGVA